MGQTGDTDQVRQGLWLGINHHLYDKVRSEFRDAKASHPAAANVIRLDSQGRRIMKQGHYPLVVQRNLGCHESVVRLIVFIFQRWRTDVLFQRLDHGRIIMAQDVKFQQIVINGMVVKVGGDDVRRHIIGRMLYRSK